ncbi:hypothetical protein ONS95_012886 [Cadophora gregata]|uniref:uncharacterized protein n=1 Tax=Cadophora gregata TaxID=51156 RepID=UPI0026DD89D6|nr:uncharacterized protein ONS95_012886 [Cadophora gregata]KAK0101133.1 hypothetical protein ONS96_006358 [Cadophora gregata f. sp. sojae]KAK0115835.1 hypothetical protein ONS95_012886 [Cadophora gregata]
MEHHDTDIDETTTRVENLRLGVARTEQSQSSSNDTGESKTKKNYNELPTELKIMIWEYCLPGRRLIQFSVPLRRLRIGNHAGDPPLPTALHICRLSRETTLKEYRLVYEHHIPYYETYRSVNGKKLLSLFPVARHRPICFSPKIDQFCIDASEMYDYQNDTELQKVLEEFPGCLDDIQVLEVRHVTWGASPGVPDMRTYQSVEYGVLNHFRNLKELHMISAEKQQPCGSRQSLMVTRRAHASFMKWYEKARDLDPEGSKRSVPKVSFHCYREKRVMSDDDRRHWKKLYIADSEDLRLSH